MLIEEKKLDWIVFKLRSKLGAGHLYSVKTVLLVLRCESDWCQCWELMYSSFMGGRYTFYRASTYHYLISLNTCCYSKLRIDIPCLHHDVESSSIVFLCMSMHCESLQITCLQPCNYKMFVFNSSLHTLRAVTAALHSNTFACSFI